MKKFTLRDMFFVTALVAMASGLAKQLLASSDVSPLFLAFVGGVTGGALLGPSGGLDGECGPKEAGV